MGSDFSCLASSDGHYLLILQGDGNVVLYGQPQHIAIWSSKTQGRPGDSLTMQPDGNLVLYGSSGAALWNSNTAGSPGAYLVVQTDGNVVAYLPPNQAAPAGGATPGSKVAYGTSQVTAQAVWASGTNQPVSLGTTLPAGQSLTAKTYLENGQYELDMFAAGMAEVWSNPSSPCPTFMFPTPGATSNGLSSIQLPKPIPGSYLSMQTDGNLVLYAPGNVPIWASNTAAGEEGQTGWPAPIYLALGGDGNLGVYDGNGPLWKTDGNTQLGPLLCPGETLSGIGGLPGDHVMSLFYDEQGNSATGTGAGQVGFAHEGNGSDWELDYLGETGTNGANHIATGLQANSYMIMQSDGNLVIYPPGGGAAGTAEWASGTSGNGGAYAYFWANTQSSTQATLYVMPPSSPGTSTVRELGDPSSSGSGGYTTPPAYYGSEYYGGSCFNCTSKGTYYTG